MTDHEPEPSLEVERRREPEYIPEECPHMLMHGDHMWIEGDDECADCGLTRAQETRNHRMARQETN